MSLLQLSQVLLPTCTTPASSGRLARLPRSPRPSWDTSSTAPPVVSTTFTAAPTSRSRKESAGVGSVKNARRVKTAVCLVTRIVIFSAMSVTGLTTPTASDPKCPRSQRMVGSASVVAGAQTATARLQGQASQADGTPTILSVTRATSRGTRDWPAPAVAVPIGTVRSGR